MIKAQARLIIAAFFPVIALMALAGMKHYRLTHGTKQILPIQGYDPRDLLAGNFLRYQVIYPVPKICGSPAPKEDGTHAFVCLDPPSVFDSEPERKDCRAFIAGECRYTRFEAGLERFYIPQEHAPMLEQLLRDKKAEIEVAISPTGQASVIDLRIDGKSWRSHLKPR